MGESRFRFVFASLLVCISLVIILTDWSSAATNITMPVDGANLTKTNVLFNVSYTNGTDIANPINATFFVGPNGNATQITAGNTTAAAGCSSNACWVVLNLSSAVVADGNYTVNATIYNASASISVLGNVNASLGVRFDTTPPNVAEANFSNPLISGQNYSELVFGILVLNVSISDVTSSLQAVYFNITNSSGGQNASVSATNSAGNQWNATLNLSHFPDGLYNVTVYVNDTSGNLNSSARVYQLTFDNSAPAVSLTCTPNPVTQGNTITCSCSSSDAHSGIRQTTNTANPSTSLTGSISTSCSSTNHANISASASYTYSVSSSGSGSSGTSGGSSGAVSWTKTLAQDSTELSQTTPLTQALGSSHRVKLKIGGEAHTVGVKSIGSSSVTIQVASTPQDATLNVGDTKKFELNGDGFYDLSVTLKSITAGKANLDMVALHEAIPSTTTQTTTGSETPSTTGTNSGAETASGSSWVIWVAVLLVVVVVAVIFLRKRRK